MLFIAAPSPTRACIHCRFRAVQLALQARRSRTKFIAPSRHGSRHRGPPKPVEPTSGRPSGLTHRRLTYVTFQHTLEARLKALKSELQHAPVLSLLHHKSQQKEGIVKEDGNTGHSKHLFERTWNNFVASIAVARLRPLAVRRSREEAEREDTWFWDFHRTFESGGPRALDERIKHAFYGYVVGARFTRAELERQQVLADLRYPGEWFVGTRALQRKIHVHVGPTNSGKTYHALQRLEQASQGIYAGPLRLLAHEVYSRMNAKGRSCTLMTGEERRPPAIEESERTMHGSLYSCTVEMIPTNHPFDVAVIDEIQMLSSADRGWAWTHALLGVMAREVHVCGEERTVPLIKEICASIGEEVEIHRYSRLTPLEMDRQSLNGNLKNLRKGDCVVSFSVMGIHALKRAIEKQTGKQVAIVYGSLPPETRAQQARLFNEPDNDYDFLVASDAIGMGLNLAVKRIIFEAASKFDGSYHRRLSVADIKQIGGRAGRYRTSYQSEQTPQTNADSVSAIERKAIDTLSSTVNDQSTGYVTTLEKFDYPVVAAAMSSDPEPISTAGIFPPASVMEKFANYFPPGTPFSYILTRLHELSRVNERFHLCNLRDRIWLADIVEPIRGLSIGERAVFVMSPASMVDIDLWKELLPEFARCIAENEECQIPEIKQMPLEVLEQELSTGKEYLRDLERLHKSLVVYLWLSYRFAGVFSTRALAFHVKGLVENKIEQVLSSLSFSDKQRRQALNRREQKLLSEIQESLRAIGASRVIPNSVESEDPDALSTAQAGKWQEQEQLDSPEEEFKVPGHEDNTPLIDPLEEDALSDGVGESCSSAAAHQRTRASLNTNRPTRLDDLEAPISKAQEEGLQRAVEADDTGEIEEVSDERPSIAEVNPQAQPAFGIEPQLDLQTGEIMAQAPRGTQDALLRDDDAVADDGAKLLPSRDHKSRASDSKLTESTVPLKHLVQIEGNITEVERKLESRP